MLGLLLSLLWTPLKERVSEDGEDTAGAVAEEIKVLGAKIWE